MIWVPHFSHLLREVGLFSGSVKIESKVKNVASYPSAHLIS
jgi:hypothetical protein